MEANFKEPANDAFPRNLFEKLSRTDRVICLPTLGEIARNNGLINKVGVKKVSFCDGQFSNARQLYTSIEVEENYFKSVYDYEQYLKKCVLYMKYVAPHLCLSELDYLEDSPALYLYVPCQTLGWRVNGDGSSEKVSEHCKQFKVGVANSTTIDVQFIDVCLLTTEILVKKKPFKTADEFESLLKISQLWVSSVRSCPLLRDSIKNEIVAKKIICCRELEVGLNNYLNAQGQLTEHSQPCTSTDDQESCEGVDVNGTSSNNNSATIPPGSVRSCPLVSKSAEKEIFRKKKTCRELEISHSKYVNSKNQLTDEDSRSSTSTDDEKSSARWDAIFASSNNNWTTIPPGSVSLCPFVSESAEKEIFRKKKTCRELEISHSKYVNSKNQLTDEDSRSSTSTDDEKSSARWDAIFASSNNNWTTIPPGSVSSCPFVSESAEKEILSRKNTCRELEISHSKYENGENQLTDEDFRSCTSTEDEKSFASSNSNSATIPPGSVRSCPFVSESAEKEILSKKNTCRELEISHSKYENGENQLTDEDFLSCTSTEDEKSFARKDVIFASSNSNSATIPPGSVRSCPFVSESAEKEILSKKNTCRELEISHSKYENGENQLTDEDFRSCTSTEDEKSFARKDVIFASSYSNSATIPPGFSGMGEAILSNSNKISSFPEIEPNSANKTPKSLGAIPKSRDPRIQKPGINDSTYSDKKSKMGLDDFVGVDPLNVVPSNELCKTEKPNISHLMVKKQAITTYISMLTLMQEKLKESPPTLCDKHKMEQMIPDMNSRIALTKDGSGEKKNLDENGNALASNRLEAVTTDRKGKRRLKMKNYRNIVTAENIEGHRGEDNIESLIQYIESPSGNAVEPNKATKTRQTNGPVTLVSKGTRGINKLRAKEDEGRKRRSKETKIHKSNSLEEISKTKLEDLTSPSNNSQEEISRARPKKQVTLDDAQLSVRSLDEHSNSTLDDTFATSCIKKREDFVSDDGASFDGKKKKEKKPEILSESAPGNEFHLVQKKQRRKKRQVNATGRTNSSKVSSSSGYYSGRGFSTHDRVERDGRSLYRYRHSTGQQENIHPRRKSASSVPPSDNSDCSDDGSVCSLPVSSTTPRPNVGKTSTSGGSTPQASYADIARSVTSPPRTACTVNLPRRSTPASTVPSSAASSGIGDEETSASPELVVSKKDAMTDTNLDSFLPIEEYPPLKGPSSDLLFVEYTLKRGRLNRESSVSVEETVVVKNNACQNNLKSSNCNDSGTVLGGGGTKTASVPTGAGTGTASVGNKRPPVILLDEDRASPQSTSVAELTFGFEVNHQLLIDENDNSASASARGRARARGQSPRAETPPNAPVELAPCELPADLMLDFIKMSWKEVEDEYNNERAAGSPPSGKYNVQYYSED